jgi:DNA polymerase-3 subunit epsilon
MSRIVLMDTETTGLKPENGERIIEICGMEMINRKLTGKVFHYYTEPDGREIPEKVAKVHGITNAFLTDKNKFKDIEPDLKNFINGDMCVFHNAEFDVKFIDSELNRMGADWRIGGSIATMCTLRLAWFLDGVKFKKGYKLDNLMKKFKIEIPRDLHGAKVDVQILSEVYLALTKPYFLGEWE